MKKESIKPDIIIWKKKSQLLVEIAYTHKVDEKKFKKIKNNKLNAIEINLEFLDKNSSRKEIENELKHISNIEWIYNKKLIKQIEELEKRSFLVMEFLLEHLEKLKTYANAKRIYNCPLNKKVEGEDFIDIHTICLDCDSFIELEIDYNPVREEFEQKKKRLFNSGFDYSHLYEEFDYKDRSDSGFIMCIGKKHKEFNSLISKLNN